MSDNKKYYYIRLKENFFDSPELIAVESMKNGYTYSNILLKLYLKSLRFDGKLMITDRIPYTPDVLASVTRHSVGDVKEALKIFSDLELIEILDTGAIYVLDIQDFVGQTTTESDRKRAYRNRIDREKTRDNLSIDDKNPDKCPDKSLDKFPPEIRDKSIEIKDKSIEKELQQEEEKSTNNSGHNVHLFYQQNFGVEPPTIQQDIDYWIEDLSAPVVIEALKRTVETEKPYSYAKGIMKKWAGKGIRTIEQVEQEATAWDRKSGGSRDLGNGPGIFGQSFSNDKDYKLTEDEIQALEDKKHLLQ